MSTAASTRPAGPSVARAKSIALLRAAAWIVCALLAMGTWPAEIDASGAATPNAVPPTAPERSTAAAAVANGTPTVDARNDAATVRAITPTAIAVLANDLGGDPGAGAPLRITTVTQGAKGRVTTDGASVAYDPSACATGSDLFTYTITDGAAVDTATVVVTIARPSSTPVTDAPSLAFISGGTMTSTVPMKLSWCGVTAATTTVRAYRVVQSTNAGSTWPTTLYGGTSGSSTVRPVAVSTSYAWRVRTTDSRGRTGPYATSLVSRVTRVQDSSPAITWSPAWYLARSTHYSGGTERYSTRTGASAVVNLTNVRAFAIVSSKAPGRGTFNVYVDGTRVATISERATTTTWRRVLYTRSLTSGAGVTHRIEIRVVGIGRVDIDAILALSGKRGQAIAFTSAAPTAATVGGATYTVAATATSGYGVSFSIDPAAWTVCTISARTVTFIGAGTCVISANQSGDVSWNAAPRAQQSFAVGQTSQTIVFGALSDRTYGDAPFDMSATATSGLAVTFASTTSAVCTVSTATVTILAAGDCTIRATQAGNAVWSVATPVDQTFTVAKVTLTVTGVTANDKTYDGNTSAVLVTTGAALVGVVGTDDVDLDASGATGTFTPDASAGTGKTVEVAEIVLVGTTKDNYTLTQPTTTATIDPAPQTITFDPLPGATYGHPPVDISASTSSGLPVTFTSADTAVCTVATGATVAGFTSGTVTILAAGTCTIHADAAGDGNYTAATRVSRAFTVAKLAITVTAVTDSRTADGTTASSGVPTMTSGNLAAGDTGTWTQTFDTAAAGTGKTLTPTGTVHHGPTDVTTDYDITFVADHTGVITAGAAATLVVTAPSPQVSGVPFSFTVTAADAFGNTASAYAGTVHFTTNDLDGGITLPGDYTFVGGDNGVRTFTDGATLVTAQVSTITATDTVTGSITGTSAPITVGP